MNIFAKGSQIRINLLASGYEKLANYVTDSIVFFALYCLLAVICTLLGANTSLYFDITTWLGFLLYTSLWLSYYFTFELLTQRTPGKYLTGTKVITNRGEKPSATVMMKRTLARLIPIDPLSFDNTLSGCLHDSLSGTMVVNMKKYDETMELKNALNEIGQKQE